ncbi:MAG: 16S rRNA (cytidine(1402)-2'-O)-methyltransferase [Deltaproteobacteria bacterium GWB2_65_81]|nr:MAG: 16S rRNA (cytidine(1402)-2'-O)-methyltransferase [Deltaproteobacteria bacterium GWA2_65_63]OGP26117.1 MAG: 16S rRNA (cytidine(1402)-2'-O)-methyltransferase [Deltaproteobacteria bacterium GWB2_65_81]OGP38556.1 MAG: 16S rRNA (cytidine(1402)-2'-O)-methyltransferase [Deltaproteobacteria bacterium GWC2_66_88]HAM32457.1 16S rRNA (cytidine(1402)-2'-O)-methyltransferase [Deltaproteobacteria bacterium]
MSTGTLYVVATPLGNLEDITFRAVRILKETPVIACEDTRRTVKLLNRYEIRTPMVVFHDYNKTRAGAGILRRLREGESVALVSDAGTPAISDPGYELVRDAVAEGIPVEVIPGPSALISALVVSGLPTDHFTFEGFLPNRSPRRRKALAALSRETRTMIFYESPQRLGGFLADAVEEFGERRACIVRELTKVHEEILRGTLPELAGEIGGRASVLGEITVVVAGAPKTVELSVEEIVRAAVEDASGSSRDLSKEIAERTGLSRKEVYEEILRQRSR